MIKIFLIINNEKKPYFKSFLSDIMQRYHAVWCRMTKIPVKSSKWAVESHQQNIYVFTEGKLK